MKKAIAMLLALALCVSAAACGGEGETSKASITGAPAVAAAENEMEERTETEAVRESALPAADLSGKTIRILTYMNSDYQNSYMDVSAVEQNGETINDAVYLRNLKLTDKYGTEFSFNDLAQGVSASGEVSKSVKAGDDLYDLLFMSVNDSMNSALSGYLLNVSTLPYINTSASWWNGRLNSDCSILGQSYFLIGDMNVDTWTQSYAVYFNKPLADDYGVTGLYETVRSGKWTLDKLDELTRKVYSDLNGNGEYDQDDLYGLAACSVCIDCFWASSGVRMVRQTSDGLDLLFEDDFYSMWEKMDMLLTAPEMLYTDRPQYTAMRDTYDRGAFLEDRAVFFIEGLCVANNRLREMNSDFGILPLPKYSEDQEVYRTYSHTGHNSCVSLPATLSEKEIPIASMIAEDMAFYSTDLIRPAYYDTLLTGKIARDDDSVEMLDIMTQNISYDLAFILLSDFTWNMRSAITKSQAPASYIEKNMNSCLKKLDKAVESVRENTER